MSQVATHVILTSYSLSKDSLNLWTSYRAQNNPNLNILLSDAAGATSTAPTFAPKTIIFPDGSTTYEVDGGIYANDPEAIAVREAILNNPELKCDQIFMLSLGTGQPRLHGQRLNNQGILG